MKRWSAARMIGVVASVGAALSSFLPARTIISSELDTHTKLIFQDDWGISGVLALTTLILLAVDRRRTDIAAVITAGLLTLLSVLMIREDDFYFIIKRWGLWVLLAFAFVTMSMAAVCLLQRALAQRRSSSEIPGPVRES